MEEIHIVDTTLRDGDISLWAYGMTTGMMLPTLRHLDEAGFDSMEFFLQQRFKKFVREHKEDPWDWLRLGTKEIKKTRLRYHGGIHSGFEFIPECIRKLVIKTVAKYGVDLTRTSSFWNDFDELAHETKELRELGMEAVVNLIYSISPRHTDAYYEQKAKDAAAIKPYRICFKDVGGMLTPERTRDLVRLIKRHTGDIPIEFHAHCNNGLAPFNLLEAVKEGIRIVHTAIPPLANGSSQPSVFNVAHNLTALGYKPLVNLDALPPVSEHLSAVAQQANLPIGAPREYDQAWYRHQIPGGMISNLLHQLKLMGKGDKLDEVLEETALVRAELGYPIMVTPLSQFVGAQAAINVMVGEHYKEVTDQVIQYALGQWGNEGSAHMDNEVRAKILDRKRARELAEVKHAEPTLEEVRRQYGGAHLSDEELILRYYAGPEFVDALKSAPPRKEYLDGRKPLVRLMEEIGKRKQTGYVSIRRGDFSLELRRASVD
ncbi:MAG: biotin carboxyl carrier protein [Deltaproteobacteria bacterium]|nr:biotin carboxyl carrier protein [Deltaproteobacteria bacterium]